eukprot:gene1017-1544_t
MEEGTGGALADELALSADAQVSGQKWRGSAGEPAGHFTSDKVVIVKVAWSEPVIGFHWTDLAVNGASVTEFVGGEVEGELQGYAVLSAENDALVAVHIPNGTCVDVDEGRGNEASNTVEVQHYTVSRVAEAAALGTNMAVIASVAASGGAALFTAIGGGASGAGGAAFTAGSGGGALSGMIMQAQFISMASGLSMQALPGDVLHLGRSLRWVNLQFASPPWYTETEATILDSDEPAAVAAPITSPPLPMSPLGDAAPGSGNRADRSSRRTLARRLLQASAAISSARAARWEELDATYTDSEAAPWEAFQATAVFLGSGLVLVMATRFFALAHAPTLFAAYPFPSVEMVIPARTAHQAAPPF